MFLDAAHNSILVPKVQFSRFCRFMLSGSGTAALVGDLRSFFLLRISCYVLLVGYVIYYYCYYIELLINKLFFRPNN